MAARYNRSVFIVSSTVIDIRLAKTPVRVESA